MKALCRLLPLLLGTALAQIATAQTPAGAPPGAPAGSTALCNDGTYFSGATKSGGCRGHKGIKTWWGPPSSGSSAKPAYTATPSKSASAPAAAAPAAAPAPAASPVPKTSASSTAHTSASSAASSKAPAPGGGPGLVWLNTASNTYHCQGSEWYGKTKAGAYMSEADAKAKGGKPDHGKTCGGK